MCEEVKPDPVLLAMSEPGSEAPQTQTEVANDVETKLRMMQFKLKIS